MSILPRRRAAWERLAFAGSVALAAVVLFGSLGASKRVEPVAAATQPPSGLQLPPHAGFGAELAWVVDGVAWRTETVAVGEVTLAKLIDEPIAFKTASVADAEHWRPMAKLLRRRMKTVREDKCCVLLGENAPNFYSRITLAKNPGSEPLMAGVRVARPGPGGLWQVSTSRLVDSRLPSASQSPLPLGPDDRFTAAGVAADGTVQAAMVQRQSSLESLFADWKAAGWETPNDDLTEDTIAAIFQRGDQRVRVVSIGEDQLSLVRLANAIAP